MHRPVSKRFRLSMGNCPRWVLGSAMLCFSMAASNSEPATVNWVARFNGSMNANDTLKSLAVDPDGGIYVAGASWGMDTGYDIVTVKYDADGVRQWMHRYDGPAHNNDLPAKILVDSFGDVVVAGTTTGLATDTDYVALKYDKYGKLLWKRYYGGEASDDDNLNDLAIDADRNVYVTGESVGTDTSMDFATVKYSPTGVRRWIRRFSASSVNNDAATAIAIDPSGDPIVAGYTFNGSRGNDFTTVKYDFNGNLLWVRYLSGADTPADDRPTGLVIDEGGNAIVYGDADCSDFGRANDWMFAKYAPNGDTLWSSLVFTLGEDKCNAAAILPGGAFLFVGSMDDGYGKADLFILKMKADNTLAWSKRFNGPANGDDFGKDVTADAAGNIVVTGASKGSIVGAAGYFDCITQKYTQFGKRLWSRRYGAQRGDVFGMQVAPHPNGSLIVGGMQDRPSSGYDFLTISYKP